MAPEPGFVGRDGTRFVVDGADFPVVGVNCYFLGYCSDDTRKAALDVIRTTGANVIRAWAFLDLPQRPASEAQIAFQYWDGESMAYNDASGGLQRLDSLVALAEERGFRLILPLVNYWSDYGGMRMYVNCLCPEATRNLPPGEAGGDQARAAFYTCQKVQGAFQNWIEHVLTRVNSVTGKSYRDSPAILAWELANEPRCAVQDGCRILHDWAMKTSQFVKGLDPNHLLALGDEGFFNWNEPTNYLYSGANGGDFDAILAIPEIDFGTYHFYPAPREMSVPLAFGKTWIEDHIASGRRADKPVLMEEYGVLIQAPSTPDPGQENEKTAPSEEARRNCYAQWLQSVCDEGGAGDLLWMMGCHKPDVDGDHDEYTVYSATDVPFLAAHGDAMRRRGNANADVPFV